ncbi:peptidoglycan-binding protein [Streptomyces sp. NPDC050418]|uniref:peptidoglycan-binding protein n=1 Tax=Streptomyces sp. NPDC050418 TaxID=3365612 RepID=UPI0037AFD8CE
MCPECGIPNDSYGTPRCDCASRAAENLHETRQAGAATEGEYDPLRIRPYVARPDEGRGGPPDAADTARLPVAFHPAQPPAVPAAPRQADVALFVADADGMAATDGAAEGPRTGEGPVGRDWEVTIPDISPDPASRQAHRARRRAGRSRRTALLATAGAVLAVVAVAALTGLFSGEPEGGKALPDSGPSRSAVASTSAEPTSAGPSESASPSPSASRSGSPSASRTTSAPPKKTVSPPPSPKTSTASTKPEAPSDGLVLRVGDSGSRVRDLQYRLAEVRLYRGPGHGKFDEETRQAVVQFQIWYGVQGDQQGEYGPATRDRLERETDGRD